MCLLRAGKTTAIGQLSEALPCLLAVIAAPPETPQTIVQSTILYIEGFKERKTTPCRETPASRTGMCIFFPVFVFIHRMRK